jgi:endonuclease/exonuclease/phosphatase family metal-dependent hydrolase
MVFQIKTAACTFLLFSLLCSCQSEGQSSGGSGQDTLRIMTYNIHHANPPSKAKDSTIDLQAIARVINEAKPDLVALQEIDVHNARAGMDVNEAEVLAKLTGMHYFFTRAIYYRGGEYGDAVLSRFPIVDTIGYHLPIVKAAKEETRSLCMIKVMLPGKKKIYFASTHLGLSKETRLLQARKLTSLVKPLSLPLILGGDFNALPESKVIRLLDSTMNRSCTADCKLTIPTKRPRHKIDYIMYRPADSFKVLEQKTIDETYASDHLPVMVTLVF